MKVQKALDWRYAVQEFDPTKKLESEKLEKILDAARKTPSSMNYQPWKFFVIQDEKIKEKIQPAAYNQPKVTQAPVLVVVAHRNNLTQKDVNRLIDKTKEVRDQSEKALAGYRSMLEGAIEGKDSEALAQWSKEQSFIALGYLLFASAMYQVDAGPMGGFEPDKVSEILELNQQGYAPTALVSLGYRSDNDEAADRKKVRYEMDEIVEFIG